MDAGDFVSDAPSVNQLDLIGITILWFDMSLTFSDEVHLIWRRPKSVSSALFFANRYLLALVNCAVLCAMMLRWDLASCEPFLWSRQIIQFVTQLIV
ncbi:hypothetical protein PLICRDRAFT_43883, partial [Plicaturopsis crispa FD-325 SS-3]